MTEPTPDVKEVFGKAIEIGSAAERAAFLVEVCGDNADLRKDVEDLLSAAARAGTFMDRPAVGMKPTVGLPITEGPGTTIGRYRLMEQIGEGGMGIVYVTEQREPVRRKVALKIIKPGMDTKDVIARFEAERQALALMDHPNIARVFDAGTTDSGRPYFVMELVRGIPITEYCDQNNLTARERLELFLSVCQAVQHAHQKGVIHRDVKPSNVLVTLHDGTPVVKVIDFGVAKAINQHLTERTVYTRHKQMIGTPPYMSPEQAELSGLDVDTRTDIYSLGVLLYELLTGTTPFDAERLRQAAYDEMRRIIREEEPPKPSTRISTLGEPATAISARRKSDPKRLSQLVRGDLDWIVMKALEKNRTRRYETAIGLAVDVQRYLKDQPVEARAPSTLYRVRKFARRNKFALGTGGLVAAAVFLGVAATLWERQKGTANRMWVEAHDRIAKGDLAETEKILDELRQRGLAGHPQTLGLSHQLGMKYIEADRLEDAASLFRRTLEIQHLVLGEDHPDTKATERDLINGGQICLNRAYELCRVPGAQKGDYERALALGQLARELDPSVPYGWCLLALAQYRLGQWKASLDLLGKSLDSDDSWPPQWFLLAMVHHQLGDEALAHNWHTVACEWTANLSLQRRQEVRLSRQEAASLLKLPEEYPLPDRTVADYVEVYSKMIERRPTVAMLFQRRGAVYARLEDWENAAADLARAVDLQPDDFRNWEAWGPYCLQMGDKEGYRAACRGAFARFADDRTHPVVRIDLVVLCCLGESTSVALGQLEEVLDCARSQWDNYDRGFVGLANGLAAYRSGRFQQAADALASTGFGNPAKDETLAVILRAMAQQRLGQTDEARRLLHDARDRIPERLLPLDGPLHLQDRTVVWCMAQSLLREAEAWIEGEDRETEDHRAGAAKTRRD